MHILYYITAHGYGHGVRSSYIISALPLNVTVTIRSALSHTFFREEIRRPFNYTYGEYDTGCIQIDGIAVDRAKTLSTYKAIADRNRGVLESEVEWCKHHGISCIVADCTPFALEIAQKASIPSIVISNFTWYDIYEEYTECDNSFLPYLAEMKQQYRSANLFLALSPSNPMSYIDSKVSVPVLGRVGISNRERIRQQYTIESSKKIGLLYFGEGGRDSTQWSKMALLQDWEFLSLYPVRGACDNFHIIRKNELKYQDLTASVDLVISKPGYGVVSECIVNGVPLLYVPRQHFAEYQVLVEALTEWGHGYLIPDSDFRALNWRPYLDEIEKNGKPERMISDGCALCVREIVNTAYYGIRYGLPHISKNSLANKKNP